WPTKCPGRNEAGRGTSRTLRPGERMQLATTAGSSSFSGAEDCEPACRPPRIPQAKPLERDPPEKNACQSNFLLHSIGGVRYTTSKEIADRKARGAGGALPQRRRCVPLLN